MFTLGYRLHRLNFLLNRDVHQAVKNHLPLLSRGLAISGGEDRPRQQPVETIPVLSIIQNHHFTDGLVSLTLQFPWWTPS